MLEYNGYIGEVVYDDEVEVLHARVINSGPYPIANAEATDVEGLKREFRCSIDVPRRMQGTRHRRGHLLFALPRRCNRTFVMEGRFR